MLLNISNEARVFPCHQLAGRLLLCAADMSMPSFVDFLKSAIVKAGESARLQCTVECKPTPAKITWYALLVCLSAGPALGMFEVFSRTGPQNLGEGRNFGPYKN